MYKNLEISNKDEVVKNVSFPKIANAQAVASNVNKNEISQKMNEIDDLLAQLNN